MAHHNARCRALNSFIFVQQKDLILRKITISDEVIFCKVSALENESHFQVHKCICHPTYKCILQSMWWLTICLKSNSWRFLNYISAKTSNKLVKFHPFPSIGIHIKYVIHICSFCLYYCTYSYSITYLFCHMACKSCLLWS